MRRVRSAGWVADLLADARYALRTCRRQPAFSIVAVLSLAAGIGLNTAVFSTINTIFLQSIRGVHAPARLVTLDGRHRLDTLEHIGRTSRTLTGVAAWQPGRVDVVYRGRLWRRVVPVVSGNYFQVLGVQPFRGRLLDPAEAAPLPAVVLDHVFWTEDLAADPAVVGDTIVVGGTPAVVTGVAPRSFHGFGPERPPLWVSMALLPGALDPGEPAAGWRLFGRMAANATPDAVNAELQALAAHAPHLVPAPLRAWTGREDWSGPASPEKRIEFLLVVVLPLVTVALILWIGCSNVANLLLARAALRRKEIAIRLASGASRTRLVRLLLAESLLLALAGAAAGLLLSAWALDLIWAMLPELPRLAIEIDWRVMAYTTGVAVLATLLFGLLPALHATRVDVAPLLKGERSAPGDGARGARLRTFFLVTQFASSMAILLVAGTFVRAVIDSRAGSRAQEMDRLALAYVETPAGSPAARAESWRTVRDRLLEVPGVVSVSIGPAGPGGHERLTADGAAPGAPSSTVLVQRVDAHYFDAAGLLPLHGRIDPESFAAGSTHAVLNERAARQFWGAADVVGRRFHLGDRLHEAAAVVRDDGAEPRVFLRVDEGALVSAHVFVRTAGPAAAAVGQLRGALVSITGDRAFTRVTTLREAAMGGLQRLTGLTLVVALLVLSLAAVGLYGAVSFTAAARVREIAIRVAIGGSRLEVVRPIVRQGAVVVAAGSALGLALAALTFPFMSGMFFQHWRLDPVTIAGVTGALALATALACALPARRALRVSPMEVLRAE